jgi:ABC-type multidrug transport system fused ATPase/permease subunit
MSAPAPAPLGLFGAFRRVLRFAAPFRARFAVKMALMLISIGPLVLLPWPGKIVIDHVIEAIPLDPAAYPFFLQPFLGPLAGADPGTVLAWTVAAQLVLLVLVGAFGASFREQDTAEAQLGGGHDTQTRTEGEANSGFSLAGGLLGWLDFRWTIRLTQDLNHHYRTSLFERVHALPMTAFDDERIGDAVYRVMIDTPSITTACHRILLTPIGTIAGIGVVSFAMSLAVRGEPWLVGAALAMIPVALAASIPLAGSMRRRSHESRAAGSVTTSTAEEGLSQVLAVQSLGAGDQQRDHFDRDSWSSFGAYRAVVRTGMAAFLIGFVPGSIVVGWALMRTAGLVIDGELTRGDFLVVFTYFVQAAIAAVTLGALWFDLQGAAAGLERVFFLMDQPPESDADGARPFPGLREGLRFERVGYRYPDGTHALDDVSFEARVGTLTAVVGPAGSGKTTLAHLAARFLEPSEGTLWLDGTDMRRWTRDSLRVRISYVFQETFLFDGTIAECLRLGAPDASDEDIWRALRSARAAEFVERLPDGLATRVGRGGSQLSVGQRQRLAIARALVRESDVLILDEPTSALDPETETALVASLLEAGRNRLVLVIAHRLSTIRAADQILFLEERRLLESGTHAELVARPNGAYRRFVSVLEGSA